MHVVKVGYRLDVIKTLWEQVRAFPLAKEVATVEDVEKMRERIETVFERYDIAIENDEEYIPYIRKELNRIVFILNRWLYYDEIEEGKRFQRIAKFL